MRGEDGNGDRELVAYISFRGERIPEDMKIRDSILVPGVLFRVMDGEKQLEWVMARGCEGRERIMRATI